MSNVKRITINSILGGISAFQNFAKEGQYLDAIAIDPDYPAGSNDVKMGGVLSPTRFTAFSGSNVNAVPLWIVTNPKDEKVYVYLSNGRLISYDSSLGTETLVLTAASSSGNGAAYYNNYLYLIKNTDIDRYGPLNGTASQETDIWTGTTLGSQTALSNTAYPTLNGISMPNHPAFVHSDNALYFGDFVDGQGVIHKIKTKKGTNEGDTDDGSAYNVLDLPFGYMPTAITNFDTNLVIAAIQTNGTSINQGRAALFIWDPVDVDTFFRQIDLPDPLVTALINVNGVVYIFTGSAGGGFRVLRYVGGGQTVESVETFFDEGLPPLAGAVDALGSKICFASTKSFSDNAAVVYSLNSKKSGFNSSLHCIARSSLSGNNFLITSLKFVEQDSYSKPKFIFGERDDTTTALRKEGGTGSYNSLWRSRVFNLNKRFVVRKIRFSLADTPSSGVTITPYVYVDGTANSLEAIDSSHTSKEYLRYVGKNGVSNFFLELKWTGTTYLSVLLPIDIDIEIED